MGDRVQEGDVVTPDEIKAAFLAGGYTVETIAQACDEMDRLSSGWRTAVADASAWKSRHDQHCGLAACDYRDEPAVRL